MTRSRKNNPVTAHTTAHSEKADKKRAHRARRAKERSQGRKVDLREVSDPWTMAKDGRVYWPEGGARVWRK